MTKLHQIALKDILVRTDRGRKDFKNVLELAGSIKEHGLLNPVLLRECEGERPYELVCGERRYRAHVVLGRTHIEALVREELEDLEAKEIELVENAQREDLTWQEECVLMKQVDDLKKARHGTSFRGENPEGWSTEKTATLLGVSRSLVAVNVAMAEELAANPELAEQVKNMPLTTARKFVAQVKKAQAHKRQVEEGVVKIDVGLVLGDALELLKELPDNSVDLVVTDPPYGVRRVEALREGGPTTRQTYAKGLGDTDNMKDVDLFDLIEKVVPEIMRVLKPGRHFYVFHSSNMYTYWERIFSFHGATTGPGPLVWNKGVQTVAFSGYNYMKCTEFVLFGWKAPPPHESPHRLAKPLREVLEFKPVTTEKVHAFQKPQDLLRTLIEQSSFEGELVLDPFAGSGSTLVAARSCKRRARGFELSEKNFDAAQAWLGGDAPAALKEPTP